MQTELQAAGLQVTVRGITTSTEYSLYNTPDNQRPDIMLDIFGGDTLHVDTMLRIVFRTGAAPLNYFQVELPPGGCTDGSGVAGDKQDDVIKLCTQSASIIRDESVMVNIANDSDVIIYRAGITNIGHDPMALQGIRLADLKSVQATKRLVTIGQPVGRARSVGGFGPVPTFSGRADVEHRLELCDQFPRRGPGSGWRRSRGWRPRPDAGG